MQKKKKKKKKKSFFPLCEVQQNVTALGDGDKIFHFTPPSLVAENKKLQHVPRRCDDNTKRKKKKR
jgi:hypothetical protein